MRFAKLPLGGSFVFTTLLVLSVCTFGFPCGNIRAGEG